MYIKLKIVLSLRLKLVKLLSKETMKLLGSTKQLNDEDKNSDNVPKLELVEVALMNCNAVKNDYQQASKVICTFASNKKFEQLINISRHSLIMLKTINTEILIYWCLVHWSN